MVTPESVDAVESPTTLLSKNRLFRPVLIFVGALALILVGVWLTRSGIFPSAETLDANETESVLGISTEFPRPTNTSVAVIAPATALVTDTPQPPTSTNTPEPTPEPAYAIIPTLEAPGMGFDTVYFLGFDTSVHPFDNLFIRRAIASSIDRDGLLDLLSTSYPDSGFLPATNFTPPEILGFDLYAEVGYPFDADMARQLMAEAGYPNGEGFPTITLFHRGREASEALARQVREDLDQVLGISVNLSPFEVNFMDLPSLYVIGWRADYVDPHNFLYDVICGSYNADFIESDDYYALVEAINAEGDRNARRSLIMEFSDNFCYEGWNPSHDLGQEYKRILDQALEADNYSEARMLYVQAEIILVETDTSVVPIYHRTN